MSTGPSTTPPNLNVDLQGEYAEVQFLDDRGNVTSAPAGSTVQFASSDSTVAQVTSNPTNPLRADFTFPGAAGSFELSVNVTGANDPAGNPIPAPAPVTLTVNPGAAVGERLAYGQDQPAPAPTPAPPPVPTPAPGPTTGQTLFYFNGDAPGSGQTGTANGVQAGWDVYLGNVAAGVNATTPQPDQPVYTTTLDPSTIDPTEWTDSGFTTA